MDPLRSGERPQNLRNWSRVANSVFTNTSLYPPFPIVPPQSTQPQENRLPSAGPFTPVLTSPASPRVPAACGVSGVYPEGTFRNGLFYPGERPACNISGYATPYIPPSGYQAQAMPTVNDMPFVNSGYYQNSQTQTRGQGPIWNGIGYASCYSPQFPYVSPVPQSSNLHRMHMPTTATPFSATAPRGNIGNNFGYGNVPNFRSNIVGQFGASHTNTLYGPPIQMASSPNPYSHQAARVLSGPPLPNVFLNHCIQRRRVRVENLQDPSKPFIVYQYADSNGNYGPIPTEYEPGTYQGEFDEDYINNAHMYNRRSGCNDEQKDYAEDNLDRYSSFGCRVEDGSHIGAENEARGRAPSTQAGNFKGTEGGGRARSTRAWNLRGTDGRGRARSTQARKFRGNSERNWERNYQGRRRRGNNFAYCDNENSDSHHGGDEDEEEEQCLNYWPQADGDDHFNVDHYSHNFGIDRTCYQEEADIAEDFYGPYMKSAGSGQMEGPQEDWWSNEEDYSGPNELNELSYCSEVEDDENPETSPTPINESLFESLCLEEAASIQDQEVSLLYKYANPTVDSESGHETSEMTASPPEMVLKNSSSARLAEANAREIPFEPNGLPAREDEEIQVVFLGVADVESLGDLDNPENMILDRNCEEQIPADIDVGNNNDSPLPSRRSGSILAGGNCVSESDTPAAAKSRKNIETRIFNVPLDKIDRPRKKWNRPPTPGPSGRRTTRNDPKAYANLTKPKANDNDSSDTQ